MLNPDKSLVIVTPVHPQPFALWRAGVGSCADLEVLHTYTGAVAVGQSLELWICCPLDMLGNNPYL